jgi:hypothetical protein
VPNAARKIAPRETVSGVRRRPATIDFVRHRLAKQSAVDNGGCDLGLLLLSIVDFALLHSTAESHEPALEIEKLPPKSMTRVSSDGREFQGNSKAT